MRIRIFLILAAFAAMGLVAETATDLDPFAFLAGRELSALEAALLEGGDARIDVDGARSRVRVRVWDNEYESRLGRLGPIEDYTIEAHNRIVETKDAPFYPSGASQKAYAGQEGLTTRPGEFPEGSWNVTAVQEREGKYGPFMIKTDAVGTVEVYKGGEKLGTANDVGYAMHSNTNDFSRSKSYGCIIIKQEDNARVAASLRRDTANFESKKISPSFNKEAERAPKQVMKVRGRSER